MFKVVIACALVAFGAAIFAGPMWAADVEKTHDGFVVSVDGNKLSMSDKDGKNAHTHVIGADAKITLNGQPSELISLQKGDAIQVTTNDEGNVTAIAATRDKT
jgi:hypothetical protein